MVRLLGRFEEKNNVRFHANSIAGKIMKLFENRNVNTAVMSIQDICDGLNVTKQEERVAITRIITNPFYKNLFHRVCRAHYRVKRYRNEWQLVQVPVD